MLRFAQFVIVVLCAVLMLACSSGENFNKARFASSTTSASNSAVPSSSSTDATAQKVSLEQADVAAPNQSAQNRKIIRNADLRLQAAAPAEVAQKIGQIVESKNGFVVTSDAKAANNDTAAPNSSVNLTVRVPAAQFDQTLQEIRPLASRVTAEKVTGQDVTEEFLDLEADIAAKKAVEAQFLEIMKSARTVADALEIQRQIGTVRAEINKLEGRRKFLENQTSLSTITIIIDTPTVFAGNSNGFFAQLTNALSDGVNGALWILLLLIRVILALLPLIILFSIPIWLIIRYINRRNAKRKLAQQFAQDEKL